MTRSHTHKTTWRNLKALRPMKEASCKWQHALCFYLQDTSKRQNYSDQLLPGAGRVGVEEVTTTGSKRVFVGLMKLFYP